MIITARQLEDLHRSHGGNSHVTLPYRARLTPLASDFVRARKLVVGYGDVPAAINGANGSVAAQSNKPVEPTQAAGPGTFLWWCDGPCGPAKAAVVAEERQATLRALDKAADVKHLPAVVKAIAAEVKTGRAAGGVLLVQSAALAVVYANRVPSLRAIPGSSLESVEQGIRLIAANVLVIEYSQKTLQQMRNMLARFLRAPRTLSEEAARQIQELASCG